MDKITEALKLAEEALLGSGYYDTTQQRKALAAIREARAEQEKQEPVAWEVLRKTKTGDNIDEWQYIEGWNDALDIAELTFNPQIPELQAAPQPMKQEPVALPFNCWSTNDGDSWYEHPADAQLIYDTLGDDAKVGDEFEVTAGWTCVTARYRIVSQDGDDFEVECISHPQDNAAPVRTKDLTDDEIDDVRDKTWCLNNSLRDFARAVIEKFKEKNK